MTEFIYRNEITESAKTEVERIIDRYRWLVPARIQRVFIKLDAISDRPGNAASTMVTREYRFANIDISATWLALPDEEKEMHIIHELVHLSNCPYADFVDELVYNAFPKDENPKLHDYLIEQSRRELEGMTQDLAWAIYQRFHTNDQR